MPFLFETSKSRQWPGLQAEHDVLESHLQRHPHAGHLDYLDTRVADPERGVALYYAKGIGMGDGRKFAMVWEGQIVWFIVLKVWGQPDPGATPLRVESVMIPEAMDGRREAIQQLFADAMAVYENAQSMWELPTRLLLDYGNTCWNTIPRRHSWLYWKTEAASAWSKAKPKLSRAFTYATCPLVIVVLLGVLAYLSMAGFNVPVWSVLLVGAWLVHRLDWYDNDQRFLYWCIGVFRLKNPSQLQAMLQFDHRLMHPVRLQALTVDVLLAPPGTDLCTVVLTNRSWFFVPYASLSGLALASAVAPGFIDALRAENKGAVDTKKLKTAMPDLAHKWLLPRQRVEWKVRLLAGFPPQARSGTITSIVSISKHVSGERNQGPRSFALPLTVTWRSASSSRG